MARLRDLRLVLADDGTGVLDCHPLIRGHFAEFAAPEGHSRLYEHYSKQAPYRPDTEGAMRPLFCAIYHGCQVGRHVEALNRTYRDRVLRDEAHYLVHTLGAFGTSVSLLSNFFTTPWITLINTLSPADQSWVFNGAAFGLWALGHLAEAVDP